MPRLTGGTRSRLQSHPLSGRQLPVLLPRLSHVDAGACLGRIPTLCARAESLPLHRRALVPAGRSPHISSAPGDFQNPEARRWFPPRVWDGVHSALPALPSSPARVSWMAGPLVTAAGGPGNLASEHGRRDRTGFSRRRVHVHGVSVCACVVDFRSASAGPAPGFAPACCVAPRDRKQDLGPAGRHLSPSAGSERRAPRTWHGGAFFLAALPPPAKPASTRTVLEPLPELDSTWLYALVLDHRGRGSGGLGLAVPAERRWPSCLAGWARVAISGLVTLVLCGLPLRVIIQLPRGQLRSAARGPGA